MEDTLMSMDSQEENSKKFQKNKKHLTGINKEVIFTKGDCEIHKSSNLLNAEINGYRLKSTKTPGPILESIKYFPVSLSIGLFQA
jgi:hypothetical protein